MEHIKNISKFKKLKYSDWISYSGNLLILRDQAHLRIKNRTIQKLSFNLKNSIVLYAGPSKSEEIIIGPTTSKRMDNFLDLILSLGVIATIGKGPRNKFVNSIIKQYKAPYFVLYSGVSAYLNQYFSNEKIIAFEDLGPEAIRQYTVNNLPLFTAIDADGNSFWN